MAVVDLHLFHIDNCKGKRFIKHPEDQKLALGRFSSPCLQERFMLERFLLRKTLFHYAGDAAFEVPLSYSSLGKPYFNGIIWQFSLAHSGNHLFVAVCKDFSVGVDLESKRPALDCQTMISWIASPQELKAFEAMDPEKHEEAFYLLWVKKESYAKMVGKGFREDPRKWNLGFGQDPVVSWQLLDGLYAAVASSAQGLPQINKCNF